MVFPLLLTLALSAAIPRDAAAAELQPGADVVISALPLLANGVRAYPTPFLAVARTPGLIPPIPTVLGVQQTLGNFAGFSGFVDEATGQVGFPGYGNFTILRLAFDDEKLWLLINFPYPYGRKTRAAVTDPGADPGSDDAFEVLIDPRDSRGRSRGPVYRIVGNGASVCRLSQDLPQIGQFHQPWNGAARYGTMMWDPMNVWIGAVQIPFSSLGGTPADGDVWGIQCALRYADPKITAVLSPADVFTDRRRFARVRLDRERRANYNCHWLHEADIKGGTFCVAGIVCNGGNDPVPLGLNVRLFQADREIGAGHSDLLVKARETYGDWPAVRVPGHPASATERDTVGRVTVTDQQFKKVIYDQFIPYWRPPAGERDWLKTYFAKEFTFLTGPYPSKGQFDYAADCQTLVESIPTAHTFKLTIARDGREILAHTEDLTQHGKLEGTLSVGAMPDGAKYELTASISDRDGREINRKTESFVRQVMPFEKAPPPGLSDLVVPPFTAPVIKGGAVSVWGRTYEHGKAGLIESLVAAEAQILARPVAFFARTGGATSAVKAAGGAFELHPRGTGTVDYQQAFLAGGVALQVAGQLDYDGFYRFKVTLTPEKDPVTLHELRLEIPLHARNALLIETARDDGGGREGDKCTGLLDPGHGRLWDSKTSAWMARERKGNLPPYLWLGDDERGITFSCASDQGMCHDDARPAAVVERDGQEVALRVWLVNQSLLLDKPRQFEFALQASPFKPMHDHFRLWRTASRHDEHAATYQQHGRYLHLGWGVGSYYPTYGRFLDLERNRFLLARLKPDYDVICASASSISECGGTPEYQQFWREWGSDLGWDRMSLSPLPDWMRSLGLTNPYVAVESTSNASDSNRDYRAWWLNELVKHCGVSGIYQDNPPDLFYYQPAAGYGYTRDDGVKEPTCATWNQRAFLKRVATLMVENGVKETSYADPNLCGAAQPGRSFCWNALYGEYTDSDKLSLGALRVWLSKQWGAQLSWLFQEPGAGATWKYWRALDSRLFLLDATDFSRADTADIYRRWLAALDVFWLDDSSLVWHPYYRNAVLKSTSRPSTLVSTYTATGRALFILSNQGDAGVVETVAFRNLDQYGAGGLKYYYDAESGEEVETNDGALRLFIPPNDFRLVLGRTEPWKFAAKLAVSAPDLPPQSSLDSQVTVTALARQLLEHPKLKPVAGGHQLYETWLGRLIAAMQADGKAFDYLDEKACRDVNLGDPAIQKAILFDHKKMALLVAYYNPTDTDRLLPGDARAALTVEAGFQGWPYVIEPVAGYSHWRLIDLPAHSGKLELLYPDAKDYGGPRRGPYGLGTMLGNLWNAVAARRAEMEKP